MIPPPGALPLSTLTLPAPARALIIGASGGIGAALTRALHARDDLTELVALSRSGRTPDLPGLLTGPPLDLTDEDSIARAFADLPGQAPLRLVLIASGLLSDGADLQPEKSWRQQSLSAMSRVFAVNTFGPALIARHALDLMPRQGRIVFAALSARVGSIGDNRLGGWHAYRASKAALNMLLRNYAIEMARRNPDAVIVGLHPGTVDTDLSRPFGGGPDTRLTPEQSAHALLGVLDTLTPEHTGQVFDWKGVRVPE